jgi:hypothetical protein
MQDVTKPSVTNRGHYFVKLSVSKVELISRTLEKDSFLRQVAEVGEFIEIYTQEK